MAESIRCKLDVYAAATFSIWTPRHIKTGVVGDDVTFVVNTEAVGAYSGNVTVTLTGAPTGAVVTYTPTQTVVVGNPVTVSIDTDACSAGTSDMTITAT
jgi:hypothetical protein